jgi:hypothetical protein
LAGNHPHKSATFIIEWRRSGFRFTGFPVFIIRRKTRPIAERPAKLISVALLLVMKNSSILEQTFLNLL